MTSSWDHQQQMQMTLITQHRQSLPPLCANLVFVRPFHHRAELSPVSRCHFSPLNGFNCPDDLNQKTITKGKCGAGNYCLRHEIEHTWMERAPFTVVKLHVQPAMAVVMKRRAWSMCLKCLCDLREDEIWEDTDTSKPNEQSATVWSGTHRRRSAEEFRAIWDELENGLRRRVRIETVLL